MTTINVLIPTYNTPKDKLEKCLNSLVNQVGRLSGLYDIQVFIFDDGSNNESRDTILDVISRYSGILCIYVDTSVHVGRGKARSRLLGKVLSYSNSDSEWCLFLDSDDYINDTFMLGVCNIPISKDLAFIRQTRFNDNNISDEYWNYFHKYSDDLLNDYLYAETTGRILFRTKLITKMPTKSSEFLDYEDFELYSMLVSTVKYDKVQLYSDQDLMMYYYYESEHDKDTTCTNIKFTSIEVGLSLYENLLIHKPSDEIPYKALIRSIQCEIYKYINQNPNNIDTVCEYLLLMDNKFMKKYKNNLIDDLVSKKYRYKDKEDIRRDHKINLIYDLVGKKNQHKDKEDLNKTLDKLETILNGTNNS